MRKYVILTAALLCTAMLAACSGSNTDSSADSALQESASETVRETNENTSSVATESVPQETSAAPTDEADESLSLPLYGLSGDKISASDITTIYSVDGQELTPSELTEDNWFQIICEGFAYIGEPTGICFIFDEVSWSFSGVPENAPTEYKRFGIGDSICGLTVKSAETTFNTNNCAATFVLSDDTEVIGTELDIPEIYFSGCSVEFDGSVTMTGYLSIAPEDDYGIGEGDISFVPAPESELLPVVNYYFDPEIGVCTRLVNSGNNSLKWVNEYGTINAGNIHSSSADLSGIPADGSYTKVKITVDNISMSSTIDWLSCVYCDITELEVL